MLCLALKNDQIFGTFFGRSLSRFAARKGPKPARFARFTIHTRIRFLFSGAGEKWCLNIIKPHIVSAILDPGFKRIQRNVSAESSRG